MQFWAHWRPPSHCMQRNFSATPFQIMKYLYNITNHELYFYCHRYGPTNMIKSATGRTFLSTWTSFLRTCAAHLKHPGQCSFLQGLQLIRRYKKKIACEHLKKRRFESVFVDETWSSFCGTAMSIYRNLNDGTVDAEVIINLQCTLPIPPTPFSWVERTLSYFSHPTTKNAVKHGLWAVREKFLNKY